MYSVIKTPNSFRIIRNHQEGLWTNFILSIPLKVADNNGFQIKQVKTFHQNIMYGIATKELFGISNSHKDKSSIAYNAKNGNLWENGLSKKMGPSISDGQIITF